MVSEPMEPGLNQTPSHCLSCGAALEPRPILHQQAVGEEVFEIENVPALVCPQCGEAWLSSATMETIERIVKENSG